jgi:hypothetical protein
VPVDVCDCYVTRHCGQLLLLLLLLLTAIELSLCGSSPYASTDKTNRNKYASIKAYKKQHKTKQNTENTIQVQENQQMLKGVFITIIKLPRHVSAANCHLQGVTRSL